MKRTAMRPLPLGRVTKLQALAFAGLMGLGGTAILAEKVRQGCVTLTILGVLLHLQIRLSVNSSPILYLLH